MIVKHGRGEVFPLVRSVELKTMCRLKKKETRKQKGRESIYIRVVSFCSNEVTFIIYVSDVAKLQTV